MWQRMQIDDDVEYATQFYAVIELLQIHAIERQIGSSAEAPHRLDDGLLRDIDAENMICPAPREEIRPVTGTTRRIQDSLPARKRGHERIELRMLGVARKQGIILQGEPFSRTDHHKVHKRANDGPRAIRSRRTTKN